MAVYCADTTWAPDAWSGWSGLGNTFGRHHHALHRAVGVVVQVVDAAERYLARILVLPSNLQSTPPQTEREQRQPGHDEILERGRLRHHAGRGLPFRPHGSRIE